MPTLKKVLDLKSIGAGVPLSIKEDSLGNIWVATDYGLVVCRTDRDKLAVIKVDIMIFHPWRLIREELFGWGPTGTDFIGLFRNIVGARS